MDDVRWFASNPYTAAVVPELRRRGLHVALEGDAPAAVALAMSGRVGEPAWRYARASGASLILYLWDLPPWRTARGRHDPVWWAAGRFFRLPRIMGGYRLQAGYYSRLQYITARADAVWTASEFCRGMVRERFGAAGVTVPYCYDSKRFRPGSAVRDSPPTLLAVSRFEVHKNQSALLRAAARLGREVQVRLIGRGPEAARLQGLAQQLGVCCRVETDADDSAVEQAYHTASVAVSTSRFEGFGLSPIEAIACGTPAVASDIPPHREFVGNAARLVPPDDDGAIALAIEAALAGPPADPAAVADLTIEAAADRILASLSPMLR